ncbi:hypothetical protein P175DRAFT_0455432 [Aspergillus ochraceoroseus IBT 24754]|uniref:Integral membrane protein n=2 Tax=Aspergillus ochraceoroseus TaxID=138278 RepID=A0A2T5M4P9_9EURO|nr:uncharacterized protein P175DRAFT_0455432 [Aspergillus ochraceoroseus IBT 24754]KKK15168.1 hypothetical protein AOCH_007376 [Aspergillus ochraceoroseus]PTU23518.1 hypothetical protein P175DRAFT_0455432 [Aspergillus ochraceoroseus IBT 24754]
MILLTKKQRLLLVSFALFYCFLFLVSRFRSARDPGSFFFQPDVGYQPQYSIQRIEESLDYLSGYNTTTTSDPARPPRNSTTKAEDVTFCVGVVTVKRPLQQNIDTTVASILDHLSAQERSRIAVHVLFALTSPSDHPDYNQPWVPNVVDRVLTYDRMDGAPSLSTLRTLERQRDVKRKSLIDYRLSLKSCYDDSNAPYIMMLEDDVVAQRAWYNHTLETLQTIQSWNSTGAIHDWLYLRLFYTEKFLGWNSEHWPIYTLCSISIVALVALLGLMSRRSIRPMQGILTNSFLAILCFLCVPLLIGLYFLAGRVTMQPMHPGLHVMNGHGCCSQALVFPRASVPQLIDFLEQMQDTHPEAVDSAIEALADANGLDRLAIVPSQMQHVGAASYKENKKTYQWHGPHPVKGAHGVWSMGFEKAYGYE